MENDSSRIRAFYGSFSGDYAGFTESPVRNEYEWPAARSLLPDLEGKSVVDVACGPGDSTARLADRGADVVGGDVSEGMIRVANRRYGDDVDFYRADLREPLDFVPDGSVDRVLETQARSRAKRGEEHSEPEPSIGPGAFEVITVVTSVRRSEQYPEDPTKRFRPSTGKRGREHDRRNARSRRDVCVLRVAHLRPRPDLRPRLHRRLWLARPLL